MKITDRFAEVIPIAIVCLLLAAATAAAAPGGPPADEDAAKTKTDALAAADSPRGEREAAARGASTQGQGSQGGKSTGPGSKSATNDERRSQPSDLTTVGDTSKDELLAAIRDLNDRMKQLESKLDKIFQRTGSADKETAKGSAVASIGSPDALSAAALLISLFLGPLFSALLTRRALRAVGLRP